jgi:hypothetical protein
VLERYTLRATLPNLSLGVIMRVSLALALALVSPGATGADRTVIHVPGWPER